MEQKEKGDGRMNDVNLQIIDECGKDFNKLKEHIKKGEIVDAYLIADRLHTAF